MAAVEMGGGSYTVLLNIYRSHPPGNALRTNALLGLSVSPNVTLCQLALTSINASSNDDFVFLLENMLMFNQPCRRLAWALYLEQALRDWQYRGCR